MRSSRLATPRSTSLQSRGLHRSPQSLGGSAVPIELYVEDVDAVAERAIAAGAKVIFPVADQFYGDRSGRLRDPFGHIWIVSAHKEDLTPEEVSRRADAWMKEMQAAAPPEQPAAALAGAPEG
jgi:PhnB protein